MLRNSVRPLKHRVAHSLRSKRIIMSGGHDPGAAQALRDIEEAHQAACDAGVSRYIDPATGYKVFTKASHEKRGFCCGNACRHCPFGHLEVNAEWRPADSVPKTVMLVQHRKQRKARLTVGAGWKSFKDDAPGGERTVLFWSGGKDSFLTLRALQRRSKRKAEGPERITLLTTFDGKTGKIPFQDTKITDVIEQAQHEGVDILAVPLGGGTGPYPEAYSVTLKAALKPLRVKGLAFGDLHLQELRSWREDTFAGSYSCEFPLFGAPYEDLLSRLWAEKGVTLKVSSVSTDHQGLEGIKVGDVYCEAFVKRLPEGVDSMGENGEFHTHVYHDKGEGGAETRKKEAEEEEEEEEESSESDSGDGGFSVDAV